MKQLRILSPFGGNIVENQIVITSLKQHFQRQDGLRIIESSNSPPRNDAFLCSISLLHDSTRKNAPSHHSSCEETTHAPTPFRAILHEVPTHSPTRAQNTWGNVQMRHGNQEGTVTPPCTLQRQSYSPLPLLFHRIAAIPSIAVLPVNPVRLLLLLHVKMIGKCVSDNEPCIGDDDEMYLSISPRDMNSAASCSDDFATWGRESSS